MQLQLKCKLRAYSKIRGVGDAIYHNSLLGRDATNAHPASAISFDDSNTVEDKIVSIDNDISNISGDISTINGQIDTINNTSLPSKIDKVMNATGKLPKFKADGDIESSGIDSTAIATDISLSASSGTVSVQLKNGTTGIGNTVTFDKSSISLGTVDNTSDANKPVSTATQTALDKKLNTPVSAVNAGKIIVRSSDGL